MKKICCVTGTRADYPRVRSVLRLLNDSPDFQLQLVATGSHLLPEYGNTIDEIIADGFNVDEKVPMYLELYNTPYGMTRAVGHATLGLADAFNRLAPDLVLLTVDRVETLAAASAASLMNFPIFHIQGGEVTGTIDESIRHAVTKLSHYHFAATQDAAERIIKMGEFSDHVFNTGCPYIDELNNYTILPKEYLFDKYSLTKNKPLGILTLHSVTTDYISSLDQIKTVISAIAEFDVQIIAIYSNADAGGINIIEYLKSNEDVHLVPNVRSSEFASLMFHADFMIGNSSAGIREAATFKLPVINIGARQSRRERNINVLDCDFDLEQIKGRINKALHDKAFRSSLDNCVNIYGDGNSASRIVKLIRDLSSKEIEIQKIISY